MPIGCFSWQLKYGHGPLQIYFKMDFDPRMLLLQWVWGSLGLCSVFSDNIFVATYTCLSLVLAIDFCYSQLMFFCTYFKKDTKVNKKKRMKYSEKNEFIKER